MRHGATLTRLKQFIPWPRNHLNLRRFVSTQRLQIDITSLIEEERLPFYKADEFYPVHIGEVLHNRYKVLGKLGYGSYSTVWLCRDKRSKKYVAVKVLTRMSTHSEPALSRELEVYGHLSRLGSSHIGNAYIRGLYDTFDVSSPCGVYRCLVHPPMHMSIHALRMRARSCKLSEPLLKQTLISLLQALDFLHSEANIIHTDIKASNIMLSIEDEALLTKFEKEEQEHPSPRKVVDTNCAIYTSKS